MYIVLLSKSNFSYVWMISFTRLSTYYFSDSRMTTFMNIPYILYGGYRMQIPECDIPSDAQLQVLRMIKSLGCSPGNKKWLQDTWPEVGRLHWELSLFEMWGKPSSERRSSDVKDHLIFFEKKPDNQCIQYFIRWIH